MAIYGSLGDIEVTSTDYPSIQPTLDLNFAKTKALDPRITFYRNSLATYTDDKGIIRTVPENVPRFDHDPTTGESLGLLIEESRSNFRSNSTEINTQRQILGTWAESLNTSETLAPDGSSTADKLTHTSGNVYRLSWTAGAADGSVAKTFSAYFKGVVGGEVLSIDIGDTSNTNFTLTTSWQRVSVTTSSLGNGNFVDFSSVGNSFYVWGAQVEAGSFATSYIPTSGSTVTRSADFVEMSGTNFSSWYNQSEGTIYSEHLYNSYLWHFANAFTSQTDRLFAFSDNTGGGFRVGRLTSGSFTYISPPSDGNTYARGSNIKSVCAYSGQTFLVGSFGNPLTTGTSSASNTSIDRLYFYQDSNNLAMGTTIKRFIYYPKRLTNTQLQNLTA